MTLIPRTDASIPLMIILLLNELADMSTVFWLPALILSQLICILTSSCPIPFCITCISLQNAVGPCMYYSNLTTLFVRLLSVLISIPVRLRAWFEHLPTS